MILPLAILSDLDGSLFTTALAEEIQNKPEKE